MEIHRRSIEAVADLQKVAMGSWRDLAKKQAQMVSRVVQDNSTIARSILTEGTTEEKIARQRGAIQKICADTVHDAQDVAETILKSGKETANIVNRRFADSLNNLKGTIDFTGDKGE